MKFAPCDATRTAWVGTLVLALLVGAVGTAVAGDWSQWRGPTRNGDAPDFEAPATWPAELTLSWKAEVGGGDSSPLVVGEKIFVFSRQDDRETMTALSLADGTVLWSQSEEVPFKPIPIVRGHQAGPFATPLYADGLVYTYGVTGTLSAWRAETGDLAWRREFSGEFKRTRPLYGVATSPILAGGQLITHIGGAGEGALAAFDPKTGDDVWRWDGDGPAYSSTTPIEHGGRTLVVSLAQKNLIGIDVADGELLFKMPWEVTFDSASPTPMVVDDLIVIGSGRRPTTAVRMLTSNAEVELEPAWANNKVWCDMSTPVAVGDRLFGFASQQKGQLVAMDAASGEIVWTGPGRQGENAYLITVGDNILAVMNDGTAVVFNPQASDYEELARYEELTENDTWAHPALVGTKLVLKDWQEVRLYDVGG